MLMIWRCVHYNTTTLVFLLLRVFAKYGGVFQVALKESFVSVVFFLLLSFKLSLSSDVFDCEHVPFSTRKHSTNNSLAEKREGTFPEKPKPTEFWRLCASRRWKIMDAFARWSIFHWSWHLMGV